MICYKLINFAANRDLLLDAEITGDLGVIYYLGFSNDATITNRNGMLDLWNKSAEELYDYAQVNTQRRYPATFRSMAGAMVDIMANGNLAEMKRHFNMANLTDDVFKKTLAKELDRNNPVKMHVLQGRKVLCSSVLLYDNVMGDRECV